MASRPLYASPPPNPFQQSYATQMQQPQPSLTRSPHQTQVHLNHTTDTKSASCSPHRQPSQPTQHRPRKQKTQGAQSAHMQATRTPHQKQPQPLHLRHSNPPQSPSISYASQSQSQSQSQRVNLQQSRSSLLVMTVDEHRSPQRRSPPQQQQHGGPHDMTNALSAMKRMAHSAGYIEFRDEHSMTARTSPALSSNQSYSMQSQTPSLWTDSIDAVAFNTLLAMEDIETYNVAFVTRVCGIELVPFDEDSNLGAVVVKCHTDFSRERVCDQSLLVAIAGECVVSMDYDEILSRIANEARPLKLTFHPPILDKAQLLEDMSGSAAAGSRYRMLEYASRPSVSMRLNDSGEDAPSSYDDWNAKLVPPHRLFSSDNALLPVEVEVVHKHYKMLYHHYGELSRLHQLTKDTIHDKMNEVRRLTRENTQLGNLVSERDSQLEQVQIDQSTEQQRGQQIWHKYQTLQDEKVEMEHKHAEQQRQLEELRRDLKLSQQQTRELTRGHRELQKKIQKFEQNNHQKHKKKTKSEKTTAAHQHNHIHNMGYRHTPSRSANDPLQNELRQKLRARSSENGIVIAQPTLVKPVKPRVPQPQHKVGTKKRQSAIGNLFKNLGIKTSGTRRTDPPVSSPQESKYHPQLQHMVEDGIKRKLSQLPSPNNTKNRHSTIAVNPTRARSSSLESNTGRTRKETIV